MKSILLSLLVLFLITSCAQNRIRFVKQPRQKVVKVDQSESSYDLEEAQTFQEVLLPENSSQEVLVQNTIEETDENKFEDENLSSFELISPEPTDSVLVSDDEEQRVEEMKAEIAEQDARSAKNLMLISIWSSFGVVLIGLGLIPSVILFIIGRVKLNKANRSPYITEDGKEFLKKARKRQKTVIIVWSIILSLGIALGIGVIMNQGGF